MIKVSFGGVIADYRKRHGMTQSEFAPRIGIARTYLARIENNKAHNLGLATLKRIAGEMGADHMELVRLWYETENMGESC